MAELQVIPARHGTATFVPAGQIIKIINTSGSQVIDTWAFALPKPEPKKDATTPKQETNEQQEKEETKQEPAQQPATPKTKKKSVSLPSQEDAEKATQQGMKDNGEASTATAQQKSTWGSYVPTPKWPSFNRTNSKKNTQQETEQQKNSRTWASYFPSGQGFTNYIPQAATDTVSAFAGAHRRDPSKPYIEQLQDLSKTPVGAAGWSGLSALTGSGWTGSAWSGYQAWNNQAAANVVPMEYMSMPHCHTATLHLRPKVNDTLVSNLREPVLTLIEDSSSGIHDTLIAACDPARYKGLGVEKWEEHGSCAENLVLALKELNERAGLKGPKAVGASITINSVPPPLNLFMNIPFDSNTGEVSFEAPKCKKNDYVRFKAERDVVVVMSACPQDIVNINGTGPTDAQFIVEGEEDTAPAIKRTHKRRPPPRKISSSHATSTVGTETGGPTSYRPPPPPTQKRAVPQKKSTNAPTAAAASTQAPAAKMSQAQTSQPTQATPAPRKKPAPAPVAPQKKNAAAPAAAAGDASAGDASATVTPAAPVKKKPRKLNPKPKPEA